MTWFRLPLFIWSHYATSLIMVLGTPVIAITILLVAAERVFHFGILRSGARRRPGAVPAPVLVLLASGRLHHDAAGDGRRQRAGRGLLPQAGLRLHASSRSRASAIAVLGFLVWGHHMFVAGQSVYAALIFSILSFLVAIPSAVKVFNWTATMYKGSISWETPMLYAIGFIGLFTIGGLTGLFLAAIGLDVHVTDTYFIVAHFHYIMVGGTIMGYLGGLHYWWPKISGRLYNEALAKLQRRHHLRRLQPDVLPAVHPRLPRHAAPLSRVSAGVPGAERAVVGRRVDPRRRLPDPDGLPDVVAALRPARRLESVGRRRPRVDDDVAAADRELRGDAGRDVGRRTTIRRRWRATLPEAGAPRPSPGARASLRRPRAAEAKRRRSACGCSSSPKSCSSAACSLAYTVYRSWYPDAFAAASHELDVTLGAINTVVLITSSLTMALAVHAAQIGAAQAAAAVSRRDDGARRRVPRDQERRVLRTSSSSITCPGPGFQFEAGALAPRADLLLALLRDDRAARAAHDHRPRHHARDAVVGVARHDSRRSTTARSRSAASTGTSSTSSGFSCFRCSI